MRFMVKYACMAAAAVAALAAPASADVKIKLEEVAGGLDPSLGDGLDPRRHRPQSRDRAARRSCAIIDASGRLLPEPFLNIQAKIASASPLLRRAGSARHRLPSELPRERQVLHRLFGAAARRRRCSTEAVVVAHQHGLRVDRSRRTIPTKPTRASRRSSRRSIGRSSTTTATGSALVPTASSTCRPATAATPTTGASATTS